MVINRTEKQMRQSQIYGGVYDIVLTQDEIRKAYRLQVAQYYAEDLAQNIDDRIVEAGKEDMYAFDWPMRIGQAHCDELMKAVERNDHYQELYHDIVSAMAEIILKDLGYNPETMEKEERHE